MESLDSENPKRSDHEYDKVSALYSLNDIIPIRMDKMVSLRRLEKEAAEMKEWNLGFILLPKNTGKILKPLAMKTSVPIAVVRAVMDKTIISTFYQRLGSDLLERVKSKPQYKYVLFSASLILELTRCLREQSYCARLRFRKKVFINITIMYQNTVLFTFNSINA